VFAREVKHVGEVTRRSIVLFHSIMCKQCLVLGAFLNASEMERYPCCSLSHFDYLVNEKDDLSERVDHDAALYLKDTMTMYREVNGIESFSYCVIFTWIMILYLAGRYELGSASSRVGWVVLTSCSVCLSHGHAAVL
jgi:hypothetical protein